jgi:hypothetical protein
MYRYFRDIIQGVVFEPEGAVVPTGVGCRRRPGHRSCPGVIQAVWEYEEGANVTWECPECGDNGYLTGIPENIWDEQEDILIEFVDESEFKKMDERPDDGGESTPLIDAQPEFTPQAKRIWESLDIRKRVLILNQVPCVNCPRPVTMQLQRGRVEKGDLILHGRCLECGGVVARLVEMG